MNAFFGTSRQRFFAILFVLAAFAWQSYLSYEYGSGLVAPEREAKGPVQMESLSPAIAKVHYGQEAGLRAGDRLLAVNGEPYLGGNTIARAVGASRPGDVLSLEVERKDTHERSSLSVKLKQHESRAQGRELVLGVGFLLLMPWFSLVLGAGVLLLKPWDRLAWTLALLLASFSYLLVGATVDDAPLALRLLANSYFNLIKNSWLIWLFLFALYFPSRLPLEVRHPWLKWLLVAPLAGLGMYNALEAVAAIESYRLAAWLARADRFIDTPSFLLLVAVVFLFFGLLLYRLATTKEADARRKLRLLAIGSALSMTPLLIAFLVAFFIIKSLNVTSSTWLALVTLGPFPLFPLTLGYLVVVHRALDIRMVIRSGVQHALARRGVLVLQIAATLAAILVAVSATSQASTANRITVIALAIGFVLVLRQLAEKLRVWIDRRFFRDAYQAEQVLSELSESVRTMVETEPLLETVTRRIAETLHVARIAVLVERGGGFAPAYALGYDAPPPVEFASNAVTLRELARAAAPVRVYFDDPASWVNRATGPSESERAQLQALETQLLLPLSIKDRILGFLSLGAKRSEEPYSGADLRLLLSVAGQTGLALENSRLAARIAQESAGRERLNRELEIARDVQQRFFPRKQPAVDGLDYAGMCRPAQSVGGDYYDFRLLGGDRLLGLTIGDVAGKGAPAALLMASLQASLRTQAISGTTGNLARVLENLNTLACEIAPASRFSTLFYAQYDRETRRLTWVNAGHNPPLLVRRGAVSALGLGGLAIGLSRTARYQERTLLLAAGDVLVAYTDGVTEAMNAAYEEFGEARLGEVLLRSAGQPAADILEEILSAVDAFAGDAPQHDDVTLVVLRVLA